MRNYDEPTVSTVQMIAEHVYSSIKLHQIRNSSARETRTAMYMRYKPCKYKKITNNLYEQLQIIIEFLGWMHARLFQVYVLFQQKQILKYSNETLICLHLILK